jgi:hypothetical protein
MKRHLKILRKKEVWEVAYIDVGEDTLRDTIEPTPYEWATSIEDTLEWEHDETTNFDIVIIDDVTEGDEQDVYEGRANFG